MAGGNRTSPLQPDSKRPHLDSETRHNRHFKDVGGWVEGDHPPHARLLNRRELRAEALDVLPGTLGGPGGYLARRPGTGKCLDEYLRKVAWPALAHGSSRARGSCRVLAGARCRGSCRVLAGARCRVHAGARCRVHAAAGFRVLARARSQVVAVAGRRCCACLCHAANLTVVGRRGVGDEAQVDRFGIWQWPGLACSGAARGLGGQHGNGTSFNQRSWFRPSA